MRNTVLATAIAATLALAAPEAFAQAKGSATKAEVQAIEAQMKALADRLNRLEAANTTLQSENSELKSAVERRDAEIDYLKVDKARGMNVCVVTTAKTDEEARKLLQLLGMPFRTN